MIDPNPKRNKDAAAIQQGACNPSAIAHSIIAACREMRESNAGTNEICSDPAIRLMVHQLAFITKTFELESSFDAYSKATQEIGA